MRNIILLTVDCLRADAVGCYGARSTATPAIDRLASHGARFSQAVTAGSWTQAAFPAILTSSYAAHHGGCLDRLGARRPSPVEALSEFGYDTAGFSTNPHVSSETGYDRGFRTFVELIPDEKDPALRNLRGGQSLLRRPLFHRLCSIAGRRMLPARPYSSAKELTDEMLRWLGKSPRPFFLWAHYMDAHWPYHVVDGLAEAEEIAAVWKDLSRFHHWARVPAPPFDEVQYLFNLYLNKVRAVDEQIGRLIDHLEKTGEASRTILCITSDHGEEFWEHGRWGHWESNLCDEIVRVPLVVAVPGLEGTRRVDRQVTTLDLMPTVLDFCGCPRPLGMKGNSLKPILEGANAECFTDEALCEMPRASWHRIAVRTEQFKYIWDSRSTAGGELYDLQSDPAEARDLHGEFPAHVQRFQKRVLAHLEEASETAVVNDPVATDEMVLQRLRALGYM